MFTNSGRSFGGRSGGYNPNFKRPFNSSSRPPFFKTRQPYVKVENTYGFNRNEFIKAVEVNVIDPNGVNLGLMPTEVAIQRARDEFDLDLVEVAPNAKPPVCKITDWSKFRYEQSKKHNQTSKSIDMKGMWFSPVIGEGDLNHKVERILEFVSKKHPVKVEVRFKGRMKRDQVIITMNKVMELLKEHVKVEASPKFEGRSYSTIVYPIKK